MAGPGGIRRAGAAALLGALLLASLPARAIGADGGIILASHVLSSIVADLDGDGSAEIIGVVADPDESSILRVTAWTFRGGSWVTLGDDAIEHWQAADGRTRTARLGSQTASLLAVRDGDERRVLVAVARPYDDGVTSGSCCLSFGTVRLAGGRVVFDLTPDDLGSAEGITALDLEADGRDELIVTMSLPPEDDDGPYTNVYTLLRQVGDGFAAEPIDVAEDGEVAYFTSAGATDEIPGDDLMFTTDDGQTLIRATFGEDGLRVERGQTVNLFDRRMGAWVTGAADGVLVFASDQGIASARWPRGGGIERIRAVPTASFPSAYVVGTGPGARIVLVSGTDFMSENSDPGVQVYDLALELELELDVPPRVKELWQAIQHVQSVGTEVQNLYPHTGIIPGGLSDGRAGFLGLGHLLAIDEDGSHEVREAAQLAGGDVMGLVGPESTWLARGSGWNGNGTWAWLGGFGFDPQVLAGSRITVLPFDEILAAAGDVTLDASLDGAALVESPDGPRVFAAEDGFRATVSGDPGTVVVSAIGTRASAEEIEEGQLTVTIDPGGRGGREYDVGIFTISPGGITRTATWDLTILTEPPEVTASASFELFDGKAKVVGQVTPHTTVTVDGRTVTANSVGEFRTMVDASLWPRDVVVVATDPLGNQQVRHVEAVGFVDIRALPWIPIFVVLTIGAGVVLFLRVPTVRPEERLRPDGDGLLEELDGDSI